MARIGNVFLLPQPDLPETPDALAAALEEGLRGFISRPDQMVSVRGENVQTLESITVDLSGARVDSVRRPVRPQLDETEPALSVAELSVRAEPISIFDAKVTFALRAVDVELAQASQPDNKLLLFIRRAGSGNIRIGAECAELERLIARAAGKLAQKQGIIIESVKLELAQPRPQVLDVIVTVAARKLLFRPVLHLSGTIGISGELIATISNLKCTGEGPVAALACAAITPQFHRVEGRPIALSALPLGEVQLHDVALDLINDRVDIVANFGERSARA